MKNLTKKILEYTAIFEPAEEGGYIVSVPAISGCVTQGETFEDAVKNAKDAIKGCLEVLKKGLVKAIIKEANSTEKEFLWLK